MYLCLLFMADASHTFTHKHHKNNNAYVYRYIVILQLVTCIILNKSIRTKKLIILIYQSEVEESINVFLNVCCD